MKTSSPLKLLKLLLPSLQTKQTSLGISIDNYNFLLQYSKRTAGYLVFSLSVVEDAGHSTEQEIVVKETYMLYGSIDRDFCCVYDDLSSRVEKKILQYIEDKNKGNKLHVPVRNLVQASLYFKGE